MITYEKLIELDIDLSPLGLESRETRSDYFCTPVGAKVIYWTGVDGIHYCQIEGFRETVFAVCPMNTPGNYVYPVANNLEDFLRLILACGEESAISQAYGWKREHFKAFVDGLEIQVDQAAVHEKIRQIFGLSPMEDAFGYIKGVQAKFDYRKLTFKPDYEEWAPPEPRVPTAPEWKVYFNGNFWGHEGRERAGKEIPVNKQFVWGEENWYIPAVYSCTSGLVVDLCCEVEPERVRAFIEKWDLLHEDEHDFTEEERERIEAENVLNISVRVMAELNGVKMKQSKGCGMTWIPESVIDTAGDLESRWVLEHYGLNLDKAWGIRRFMFPWAVKWNPEMKNLSLTLMQNPVSIPGIRFKVAAGENVWFTHPVTGTEHQLIVEDMAQEELEFSRLDRDELEFPKHCVKLMYRIVPDLPEGCFRITDCAESDAPRQRKDISRGTAQNATGEKSAHSIAIIGGADGPTALIFGSRSQEGKLHVACSSLHFEPVEKVEWRMSFLEKTREDITVSTIR